MWLRPHCKQETHCRILAHRYLPDGPRVVVLGTRAFWTGVPISFITGLAAGAGGRLALSPASPLVLAAVTGVALGVVVPELGRVRGFPVRLPPLFQPGLLRRAASPGPPCRY